jgi:lipopolysaccharide transport system ATP-binding protein
MSNSAISAQGLCKRFVRRRYRGALQEAFEHRLRAPLHFSRNGQTSANGKDGLWALYDVSFELGHGEALGLVGHNGAGKSVLLRVLARVTCPTTGKADLNGRVGAVLDVGAGFNRELTGRENIYLHGAILGMTKREIERKFDEIVAFSGLEAFLDDALKTYSNGMQVRLAFAVASELEPEILLIDEVLAVADAEFQRACVAKLHSLIRDGRTILLVGHDLEMLAELCPRMMWLEHGRIVRDGPAGLVLPAYRENVSASTLSFASPSRSRS